ncbi:MAG TPA: hypothetical protein ENK31_09030 [Nannocystis exedens]|nr:hypothetical protein [Nannocystis exedens]
MFALNLACDPPPNSEDEFAAKVELEDPAELTTVSELHAQVGEHTALEDRAAASLSAEVAARFAADESVTMPVYALAPVEETEQLLARRQRQLERNFGPPEQDPGSSRIHFDDGNWRFIYNPTSGAEMLVDQAHFHKSTPTEDLLSERDYVEMAKDFVNRLELGEVGDNLSLYRVRWYKQAGAAEDEPAPLDGEVYQIAVAFNQSYGDLPVIGAGGKIAVHMSPKGEVLAYESTLRASSGYLGAVDNDQMISPEQALDRVHERLERAGIDLSNFDLTRQELGYERLGRNGIQSLVAPAHAFFFTPKEGVTSKVLVEIEPAISTGPMRKALDLDFAREALRKDERASLAGELSRR